MTSKKSYSVTVITYSWTQWVIIWSHSNNLQSCAFTRNDWILKCYWSLKQNSTDQIINHVILNS